jgi:hypothetical protein
MFNLLSLPYKEKQASWYHHVCVSYLITSAPVHGFSWKLERKSCQYTKIAVIRTEKGLQHERHINFGQIFFFCTMETKATARNLYKVKVKMPLYLIKHHAIKTYWGEDIYIYIHGFLTLALDGGDWSASRPGSSIPGERVPPPKIHTG